MTVNAENVKLIGADAALSNVSIDVSNVENANLWIENLNVTSSQNASIVQFGAGSNYLTVKGTNTIVNNNARAAIDAGDGLNIIGDGTLNVQTNGSGVAIGSEGDINIGGSVNVEATAKTGAAIGSVGSITIGGTAIVTATSTGAEGISAGDGSVTYGTNTVVTNNGALVGSDLKTAVANIAARSEPRFISYFWTLNNNVARYLLTTKSAGYTLSSDGKTLRYSAADGNTLFTLKGVKSVEGITVGDDKEVTLAAINLNDEDVTITGDGYSLAVADDVIEPEEALYPIIIETDTRTITVDGVYRFASGWTGTLTVGAQNVKLLGARGGLKNVSIVVGDNANVWIQGLNISSDEMKNMIAFGNGLNTLTVKGENVLENEASGAAFEEALINIGAGLSIGGDGSLGR